MTNVKPHLIAVVKVEWFSDTKTLRPSEVLVSGTDICRLAAGLYSYEPKS